MWSSRPVPSSAIEAIDAELERLHKELDSLTMFGRMYTVISSEISKLNDMLIELAKKSDERNKDGGNKEGTPS